MLGAGPAGLTAAFVLQESGIKTKVLEADPHYMGGISRTVNANGFKFDMIYIHEPSVKVGRIQNFKNWSQAMIPDAQLTSLGLEYFCFKGNQL